MEGKGEETLPFPLLKSGKRQKVHLGRSVSTHFVAYCRLLITSLSAECAENMKLKQQEGYQ